MVVAAISVFISATRLWFVIFSFVFVGYILVSEKKILSGIGILSMFLIVLSTLLYFGFIPQELLVESSWGRLNQVFNIAKGDVYSVDTARNRLLNQLPIIMEAIKQNPIVGYGFSNVTMSIYDNNFGFVNTILLFGISGFLLFVFFFVKLFGELLSSVKKLNNRNLYKIPLKILIIAWVGILIGYFSTWDFFTMSFHKVFFISILIVFLEFFMAKAKQNESVFGNNTSLRQHLQKGGRR
jgi:O-antigen ligase